MNALKITSTVFMLAVNFVIADLANEDKFKAFMKKDDAIQLAHVVQSPEFPHKKNEINLVIKDAEVLKNLASAINDIEKIESIDGVCNYRLIVKIVSSSGRKSDFYFDFYYDEDLIFLRTRDSNNRATEFIPGNSLKNWVKNQIRSVDGVR
jgi:hypothetical protein